MENRTEITFKAIPVEQPIGTFFVGVMSARDLVEISVADVRRLHDTEFDEYIGIQRRLDPSRSKDLRKYVISQDATFPSGVILAVREENALWNDAKGELTLMASEDVPLIEVASILDGQHRVDGLTARRDGGFDVPVSIFVGADVATQANIFATVNLAQTKVNRSLVYDLLDYEKKRSPQKSAHHIAVALDGIKGSPFYERIKRLGSATPERKNETVTQAAIVESLLTLISSDPMSDRNSFLKALLPEKPTTAEHEKHPFRQMFLDEKETEITRVVLNFFKAVENRWPDSWNDLQRKGNVLPKTNGLKALMRYLKPLYLKLAGENRYYVPSVEEFQAYIDEVDLADEDFNTTTFPPGTSGESRLYKMLMATLTDSELLGDRLV